MPQFFIVTPVYQGAATIRQTIESVLQNEVDLEYWVFDAGSPDGTVDVLRNYENDPRFHWVSEHDEGQSDAINKGLVKCTGDIFNWLNSDDYLEPGALKKVSAAFQNAPHLDVVSGITTEFHHPGPGVFNHNRLQIRSSPEETVTTGVFCQPSTFWRTDICRALGGLDSSLHFTMDWHLWVKYLVRHGQKNVLLLPDVLAHYRHHADAKSTKYSKEFYRESHRIFHNLNGAMRAPAEFLDDDAPQTSPVSFDISPDFNRELYLGFYCDRMVRIYRDKNPALAREWIRRSFRHKLGLTWWRAKMALRLAMR